MRQFLATTPIGVATHRVEIGPSARATLVGGLVSPIFGAFGDNVPPLDEGTGIALLYPRSPSSLLAHIQNELEPGVQASTFITYGLASVGFVGQHSALRVLVAQLPEFLIAWELWPTANGILEESTIERQTLVDASEPAPEHEIEDGGLPYGAACQVRQLNMNLAFAHHRASIYVPEMVAALVQIGHSASRLVACLRTIATLEPSIDAVRQHHYYLSSLLELNAGLSMVISQSLGGIPPLLNSEYPVAEYSLFGIGSAARALWGLYGHLRGAFSRGNHIERIHLHYHKEAPFEPFLEWLSLDYSEWNDSSGRLSALPEASPGLDPPHLVHFSSRFGFHETAYTLGASWQSLYASSSQEWHLLTVTHEYIHSYVRRLTAVIFPPGASFECISEMFRGVVPPENALQAMQLAITQSTLRLAAARSNARSADPNLTVIRGDGYNASPTAAEVHAALDLDLRHVQEIVVHILDYLYTFAGDDARYVAAIWQSWSTVPSVTERLHEYLLRTLCALASRATLADRDERPVFREVHGRTVESLRQIMSDFDSPVIMAALAYLESEVGQLRLQIEFSQAYYVTRLTQGFLYDEDIGFALRHDDATAEIDGGDHLYVIKPGEYPEHLIESPITFLSDRLSTEEHIAGEDLEFASLWQLLLLINPDRGW